MQKCLHEKTQNNNESRNGLIWKRCPKDVFLGRVTLELGVFSAVRERALSMQEGGPEGFTNFSKNFS